MVEYNRTIFKKDSKGKLRVLNIITNDGELIQEAGLMNGKLVRHSKMCKPKNVGRSNETNAQEQAWAQAESVLTKKLKADYFETVEDAMTKEVILPMLADKYKSRLNKIDWENCYAQPKFDGQRCLAVFKSGEPVKLLSREGSEIGTMPHIVEELEKIASELPTEIILDGELYAHGLTFQENMKLIKKNRGEESKLIHFNIYDFVSDAPFITRHRMIKKLVLERTNYLSNVETLRVLSEENVRNFHEKCVSLGYEGTMVRHGNDGYKMNGRSPQLLKNKDFIDIAIELKDIRPQSDRPHLGQAVFYWKGAKDDTLVANFKGTHLLQQVLLENKWMHVGKTVELRFFEYTDDGVPRFPVAVGFRNDK